MSGAKEKVIAIADGAQPSRDPYVQQQVASLMANVAITGCSFKDFLTMAPLDGLDLSRNPDKGRDVEL